MPRLTKAQKQAIADAEAALAAADLDRRKTLAMRRSEKVERNLLPPKDFRELSRGWDFNAYRDYESVFKACSSSMSRGEGWEQTTSQDSRSLYSTELLATKALRYEMAEMFAEKLAKVDQKIDELSKAGDESEIAELLKGTE